MFRSIVRQLRKFQKDQRGAVLVEMTIVTPVMLVLCAGVFEFGNLIHDKLLMQAGLSDAARYGARCNTKLYTDANLTINCATVASNIALYGNVGGTGNPRVPGWNTQSPNVTVTIGTNCKDAVVSGVTQYRSVTPQVCIVRADGTYAYSGVGLLSLVGIGTITLTGYHEERLIRF